MVSAVTGSPGRRKHRPVAKLPLAERVAAEVAALGDLPREDLAKHWAKRFGREPPKGCGRRLLELAAAFGIQEKAFGGLTLDSRKALAPELELPAKQLYVVLSGSGQICWMPRRHARL